MNLAVEVDVILGVEQHPAAHVELAPAAVEQQRVGHVPLHHPRGDRLARGGLLLLCGEEGFDLLERGVDGDVVAWLGLGLG